MLFSSSLNRPGSSFFFFNRYTTLKSIEFRIGISFEALVYFREKGSPSPSPDVTAPILGPNAPLTDCSKVILACVDQI